MYYIRCFLILNMSEIDKPHFQLREGSAWWIILNQLILYLKLVRNNEQSHIFDWLSKCERGAMPHSLKIKQLHDDSEIPGGMIGNNWLIMITPVS